MAQPKSTIKMKSCHHAHQEIAFKNLLICSHSEAKKLYNSGERNFINEIHPVKSYFTGQVIKRSRELIVRMTKGHSSFGLLLDAQKQISMMTPVPFG